MTVYIFHNLMHNKILEKQQSEIGSCIQDTVSTEEKYGTILQPKTTRTWSIYQVILIQGI